MVVEGLEEAAAEVAVVEEEDSNEEEDIVVAIEAVVGVSPPIRSREMLPLTWAMARDLNRQVTSWSGSLLVLMEALIVTAHGRRFFDLCLQDSGLTLSPSCGSH